MADQETVPLDEPGRLAKIVVPLMLDEERSYDLENGASGALLLGAIAQDDCAAFELHGDQILVAGSDYVRGPKFRLFELGYLSYYDIGWYLAGANLSDVAAMGAVPLGLLSVVRYPKTLTDSEFSAILEGIRDSCIATGARNIGGDIGSAERVILSAAAFGVVEPESLLTRTGARVGQVVCLTGPTGLAGAAMKVAGSTRVGDLANEDMASLLVNWKRVRPRVKHGRIFARSSGVSSCIDTSDGLKGALETLAEASGVRFSIDESAIPVVDVVARAAAVLDCQTLELVFGDSVDFELVATADESSVEGLRQQCDAAGLGLFVIGRVEEGAGVWLDSGSRPVPIPGTAWRHQQ